MSYVMKEKVAEMVQECLEKGVIRPSNSPYSNPIVLVRKKDGSLRFCVDYRRLNSITRKDAYPMPNVDAMILSLGKPQFFTTLDIKDAYWCIPMEEDSIEKTAFPTPNGLYEWTVMPFGLANAPATFERFIERVMRDFLGKFMHVYFDDLLIVSETWADHLQHIENALERLRQAGLRLKSTKCRIAACEVEFLGHKITVEGLTKDDAKVKAVREFPRPQNLKQLRQFLGLTGYYRKFVRGFALIARPLNNLMKEGIEFEWTDECHRAFQRLIHEVCEEVTLKFPDFKAAKEDPTRALVIQTDASKEGLAGILGQLDGTGKSRPIYFSSRACTDAESRYSATELEALALKVAVHKFAPFIMGLKTIVETDHSALVMFSNPKECGSARVDKWAMAITSLFDLEVRYRPGKSNANADALSRAFRKQALSIRVCTIESIDGPNTLTEANKDSWISGQIDGEFGEVYKFIDKRLLPQEVEKIQRVIAEMAMFTIRDRCLYFVDPNNAALRLVVPKNSNRDCFMSDTMGCSAPIRAEERSTRH